jgi:hypothetical protein
MARGSRISSSSQKVCPANKFSFMSGCTSFSTILAFIALGFLLIICVLIMMKPRSHHKGSNKSHHTSQNAPHIRINNSSAGNFTFDADRSSFKEPESVERVGDMFEPTDGWSSPNEGTGTATSDRIKYDINVNIRDVDSYRQNPNNISYAQYQADKNIERIVNPILPPERSYQNTYGTPINIPSRGPNVSYQQVGILYKEHIENPDKQPGNNTDSNILPLFGRPTFNGSRRWNYYTSSDKYQNYKMPITRNGQKCDNDLGCEEIRDGDILDIPSYNGKFKVEIYNYDKPSYIPFVY